MIYFLKFEGLDYVKIGYTKMSNARLRILSYSTHSPFDVQLLLLIEGTFRDEKKYHKQFKEYHFKKEWFILSEEIKSFISDNMPNNIPIELQKKRVKYGKRK